MTAIRIWCSEAVTGGPRRSPALSYPSALSPADFHLMAPDGTAAEPLQNCLTGFAEPATRRTLAFSGVEPDRLVYGSDPLRPVAVWLLT